MSSLSDSSIGWWRWALLGATALAWAPLLWAGLRRPSGGSLPGIAVGDVAGWANLLVAIFALVYALKAGAEQGATLEAQREALDASKQALDKVVDSSANTVKSLNGMLATLESSRTLLDGQLAILRQQQDAEIARLKRAPQLEAQFATSEWTRVADGGTVNISIAERYPPPTFELRLVNYGNAPLIKPHILIYSSSPVETVPNTLGGPASADIFTREVTGSGVVSTYNVGLNVPPGVDQFQLTAHVFGENYPLMIFRWTVTVTTP